MGGIVEVEMPASAAFATGPKRQSGAETMTGEFINKLQSDYGLTLYQATRAVWSVQNGKPIPTVVAEIMRVREMRNKKPSLEFGEAMNIIATKPIGRLDSMDRAQLAGMEIDRLQKEKNLSFGEAAEQVWRAWK